MFKVTNLTMLDPLHKNSGWGLLTGICDSNQKKKDPPGDFMQQTQGLKCESSAVDVYP